MSVRTYSERVDVCSRLCSFCGKVAQMLNLLLRALFDSCSHCGFWILYKL